MASDSLHIRVAVSGTYWGKVPQYCVKFNGNTVKESAISGISGEVEFIDFDVEYETDAAVLEVSFLNKAPGDTVVAQDCTTIVKDMLLNIVSVEVDGIDLGNLLYSHSEYHTDTEVIFHDERTQLIKQCLTLGWNGTWRLTWSNPFVMWLLDTM